MCETSFFLTKNGYICKTNRSELTRELEKMVKYVPRVSRRPENPGILYELTIIDFMAYARKVPIRNLKLKTFGEFAEFMSCSFDKMSSKSGRVDIVIDLYLPTSIKSSERSRRQKVDPIEVTISNPLTPIPVELDQFWASSGNKQRFQQFFINWFITNNKKCIPVYLGGGHNERLFKCLRIDSTRKIEEDKSLYNEYEEADSRLLFHITQSVQYCSFNRVSIVASDTDVFVSLIHHFHAWQLLGLKELLMVCGSGTSKCTINIHSLIDALPTHLPGILPAVHALTGCDSTSKIATKLTALKTACGEKGNLLKQFLSEPFSEFSINNAEVFLVTWLKAKSTEINFDELRYEIYHKKPSKLEPQKFPCTSKSLRLHIQRAYFQSMEWNQAAFQSSSYLNPILPSI